MGLGLLNIDPFTVSSLVWFGRRVNPHITERRIDPSGKLLKPAISIVHSPDFAGIESRRHFVGKILQFFF